MVPIFLLKIETNQIGYSNYGNKMEEGIFDKI